MDENNTILFGVEKDGRFGKGRKVGMNVALMANEGHKVGQQVDVYFAAQLADVIKAFHSSTKRLYPNANVPSYEQFTATLLGNLSIILGHQGEDIWAGIPIDDLDYEQ